MLKMEYNETTGKIRVLFICDNCGARDNITHKKIKLLLDKCPSCGCRIIKTRIEDN
jgi:DNA-directed RNA polymerase subunit RPC12/RpoP